ncbi:uncharacterized protein LOC110032516 [Phalaenopsis equestris]|uniref:uncharacterized protein LOC110032516 n=1 Tax=Phalaenopsis equestris TaxID=78828 RepID=UPI0009E615C2|nr:uncharacterized protein LOC110032516 [Phalaenopsis equestris]
MTHDMELFNELKSTEFKKVRIGNGEYIVVKGKCTVAIASCSGTKLITDVLYVPDIDQNLLNVGQLIEKEFKVRFMEKACVIEDATGQKMFEVKMAGMSFSLNPMQEEQKVFGSFPIESSVKHAHSLEVSLINEGNEGHLDDLTIMKETL